MNDLIERINKTLENGYSSLGNYSALSIWELLSDCRAEIGRLTVRPSELLDKIERPEAARDEVGCDEVARPAPSFDAQREDLLISYIDECIMLRAALVRAQGDYVPMTDDDFDLATGYKTSVDCRAITQNQADVMLTEYREVEAAFIKRAGLRVKEKA